MEKRVIVEAKYMIIAVITMEVMTGGIATSADQFNQYYAVDSSLESPAYTAEMLQGLLGSDYATFTDLVSKYSFEDISSTRSAAMQSPED